VGGDHRTLRQSMLLAVLVAIILLEPYTGKKFITVAFLSAMIAVALLLDGRRRRTQVAAAIMALPAVLQLVGTLFFAESGRWTGPAAETFTLLLMCLLVASMFYCGYLILTSLVGARQVGANEIIGTISLYLVIGLIWAFVYGLLESFVSGSFGPTSAVSGSGTGLPYVYFSFVTQTSLGYGDVTPQLPLASRLVLIQAVIGQFYIAVVVAYLIAKFISQGSTAGSGAGE
jgi:hypothetical protein